MAMKQKVYFILSGAFAGAFLLFLILLFTVDVGAIAPLGGRVGLSTINASVRDAIGTNDRIYTVTKLTGYFGLALVGLFGCVGIFQWATRRSLAKVDREILLLGGLYVVTGLFYLLFEVCVVNVRPLLMPGESVPAASFPSSHTVMAIVIYGSAARLAGRYLKKPLSFFASVLSLLLLVVTAAGRFLSGVHWFTDVLCGVFLGCALLFAYFGALQVKQQKKSAL